MRIIKISINILLIFICITNAIAQSRVITCTNNETNFITNFKIDNAEKKITHISSLNTKNNQKYIVNTDLKILSIDENIAITTSYSNGGKILNLIVYNFKEQTYTHSGHYLETKQKPYSQIYECVVN